MHKSENISAFLSHIEHYLPSQAALKDFIHHNTLQGFQHLPFHEAMKTASTDFGYATYLSLDEFRELYQAGRIAPLELEKAIRQSIQEGKTNLTSDRLMHAALQEDFSEVSINRQDSRSLFWKRKYNQSINKAIHPRLFRILAAYLDQGVAEWNFPNTSASFLDSLHELENNGITSIFKSKETKQQFLQKNWDLMPLLHQIIGKNDHWESYLTDLLFAHPGWSGFVAMMEHDHSKSNHKRPITLVELIVLELYLELDALANRRPKQDQLQWMNWSYHPIEPVDSEKRDLAFITLSIWQEAYEGTYHSTVLRSIQEGYHGIKNAVAPKFQALFCIDDREYTLRRHLHLIEPHSQSFGTPGFFGLPFYFLQHEGHLHSKACPAPVTPQTILLEKKDAKRMKKSHVHHRSHGFTQGWIISNFAGIVFGFKLLLNLFFPKKSLLGTESNSYMANDTDIVFENNGEMHQGLRVGFTKEEMVQYVSGVLKSIGLTKNFADLVYIVGHGASSINNPYFAGYDCGACSGRPGSVNARVFALIANKPEIRVALGEMGIIIPDNTRFVGALHDTTNDEIFFYDDAQFSENQKRQHEENNRSFQAALLANKKERSLRFDELKNDSDENRIIQKMNQKSVSLFEIRPEWNHTDNALVIIGNFQLVNGLYLDKRPFLNSYDPSSDPNGDLLKGIIQAAVPVCGGINLEYYFSRVDSQNLGAGSKLPHNVVGLFGLSNGVDGDLRPGLPSQMVEIHEPVRILYIIEQDPNVVLKVIENTPALHDWIDNEWVKISVIDPLTKTTKMLRNRQWIDMVFSSERPVKQHNITIKDVVAKKAPIIQTIEEAVS
jgi:uncharacterized protein YbcC (UPF0753/DUF2309 family)